MIVSRYTMFFSEVLAPILAALVVLAVGGYALRWLGRRAQLTPPAHPPVNRLWFLAPSLVMSFFFLVYWWTTPGIIGIIVLLSFPAATLVGLFERLRAAGVLSASPLALTLGNMSSLASLIGCGVIVEELEEKLSWTALASPYDTVHGAALVLAVGGAGFLLPGLIAGVKVGRRHQRLLNS